MAEIEVKLLSGRGVASRDHSGEYTGSVRAIVLLTSTLKVDPHCRLEPGDSNMWRLRLLLCPDPRH